MSATFPQPVTLSTFPKEGSRAVHQQINWADYYLASDAVTSFKINLLSQVQSGNFTTPQTLWIDNAGTPFPVRLTSEETGQSILVPANSQGMYQLLCGASPIVDVIGYNIAEVFSRTDIFVLNTPQTPYQVEAAPNGLVPIWASLTNVSYSTGVAQTIADQGGADTVVQLNQFSIKVVNNVAIASLDSILVQFIETFGIIPNRVMYTDIALVQPVSTTSVIYQRDISFINPIRASLNTSQIQLKITMASNPNMAVFADINYSYFLTSVTA